MRMSAPMHVAIRESFVVRKTSSGSNIAENLHGVIGSLSNILVQGCIGNIVSICSIAYSVWAMADLQIGIFGIYFQQSVLLVI